MLCDILLLEGVIVRYFSFILFFSFYLTFFFSVSFAKANTSISTNSNQVIKFKDLKYLKMEKDYPIVYFTKDITPESLLNIYKKLNFKPTGKVGLKISTGEPPKSNYLRPELLKDLVRELNATIVECNTAYGGRRNDTKMHMAVAKEHGFTDITNVDILDGEADMAIPVKNGIILKENFVGTHFKNYGSYVVVSHFKGHQMAGFGGAIKNISIGFGSSMGKNLIHSGGKSRVSIWGGDQNEFCEAMADAGKSVSDYMNNGKNITYINVMNRISIDCDCNGNPAEPDIHDIGILASNDPVALDQACIDIVNMAKGNKTLLTRIKNRNGLHTLESAEKIGLGKRNYYLVDISK